MTIQQAIDAADAAVRNGITTETKIRWLAELDGRVYVEQFATHKGLVPAANTWLSYIQELITPTGTIIIPITIEPLFVSFPYDEIYPHYLLSKIHLSLQEINRANNELAAFNEVYDRYVNYINRTYLPVR